MDESTSFVFEIEEASTGIMNDGASNGCGIEQTPTGAKTLNSDSHSKLLKLLLPKVYMKRKGISSTHI